MIDLLRLWGGRRTEVHICLSEYVAYRVSASIEGLKCTCALVYVCLSAQV